MIILNELLYDNFLGVDTIATGTEPANTSLLHNGYDATEYYFLNKLFMRYRFTPLDHLCDIGCGKGRVLIMAAYYGCRIVSGYEINNELFLKAQNNIELFKDKFKYDTVFNLRNVNISDIDIYDTINKVFLFSPFHVKIFIKTIYKIYASLMRKPRKITMFLYQPADSMVKFMNSIDYFLNIETVNVINQTTEGKTHYCIFAVYETID